MGRMLSTFVSLAASTGHNELPGPPWAFGLTALVIFAVMLGVLFAFRQAATKVAREDNTVSHDDHGAASGHHTGDHH